MTSDEIRLKIEHAVEKSMLPKEISKVAYDLFIDIYN